MKNSDELPGPPEGLTAEAEEWWRRVVGDYRIEDVAGRLLLQTALECFDRMREAQRTIAADGVTLRDRFDQCKAHPLLTVERDARAQMLLALKALNLDLEPLRDRGES